MPYGFVSDGYCKCMKPYYDASFIMAAAWMLSRKCIETVGGFDTLLFSHYEEDVNYCQRVLYHQLRITVNTKCTICHDREKRDQNNYQGRALWNKKNRNPWFKVKLGDINDNIDLAKEKRGLRLHLMKSVLLFQKQESIITFEKVKLTKLIKTSRAINAKTGLHWL